MADSEQLTAWFQSLQHGDDAVAAQKLFEHYFPRLVGLAARRLPAPLKRVVDEEDVASSALHSLYRGAADGRFAGVRDRDDLWALLTVIVSRRASKHVRDATTQKRGAGRIRGESVFINAHDAQRAEGIDQAAGEQLPPDLVAEIAEQSERLLAKLPDEQLRAIALYKMEGYSNAEIAGLLGCGLRTVERRLTLIRRIWTVAESAEA